MSLLHQEPVEGLDDAAQGESFTKGTSHVLAASIVATILVTVAIALYVIAGQKPPVASGQILDIWAHPMHTVTPGFDAGGTPVSQETFDQVLVFARVRLYNQSKQPLFLHQILTNITMPDGAINSSYATTASQYERVFMAYPQLGQWHTNPLSINDLTINPGQTVEGTFVSSFRMSKEQWDARKALDFGFGFRYQTPVKLAASGPVIDR